MQPFDLISRYFWAVCIAITFINFGINRGQPPRLPENDLLRRRILLAMIAPWLVMGAGIIFGGVPGMWNYFRPQDLNPYVWSWYLSVLLLSVAFAYWVLIGSGASKVAELRLIRAHFFGKEVLVSERWIKVYAAIAPLFVILWLWLAWNLNMPLPKSLR
jgi:hypothetical protein